ncbi:hypothetical protein AHF37_03287 [Paragonimus kellicotti]|nr:hypothetical protein AHF37_03287 [Paragonimus kellicotti]
MSTQKGNDHRTRPPKYKNTVAFKNTMHDTSKRTQDINHLTLDGLCSRCTGIIEWKAKYKKYRPLTQPSVCIKCHQKTVKRAYYTVCASCTSQLKVCGKCGQSGELMLSSEEKNQQQDNQEFENSLRQLRERERRTLLRIAQSSAKESSKNSENSHSQSTVTENFVPCGLHG